MKSKITIVCFILVFASCIPQKEIEYLQPGNTYANKFQVAKQEKNVIKPNDQLLINVTSFDDISFNYFQSQKASGSLYGSNELSLSSIAYSVDQDGMIHFPILGEFKVGGMTLKDASFKLKEALSSYFNQPNVSIKFAFKKITILGAVNTPGNYIYTKDQINIFEALGLAHDITIHGNRKDVYLIRKINNEIFKHHIDLTNDKLAFEAYFYLKPDDVLYVKPRRSANWSTVSTPLSLVFSSISTALLLVNFFSR